MATVLKLYCKVILWSSPLEGEPGSLETGLVKSYLSELEAVEKMHLVTAEAGVAEVVACTCHTVVAFASNGTHVAVATGDPQVQGGLLGMQTSGGG